MTRPRLLTAVLLLNLLIQLQPAPVHGADWPLWRYDAGRSAASPQPLAATLHLQWVRELPPLKPAWPDQPKMTFDAAYAPVVMGGTLFVGSSRTDDVTAYDTATGAEKWRFPADGPVRLAPAAGDGKVYFVSDDGYLYCVDAAKGSLLWKFRGGPSDRRVLGNERLISTWPARGGPVLADGTVYFAAGIWPFMGIFLHAVDANTGKAVWTNEGDGSLFIKQPHQADAFAGVAPQGNLVVHGDYLLVPGGRSVPACYDRKTGRLVQFRLADNSKLGGGAEVAAAGRFYFNGGAAFDLTTGQHLAAAGSPVVLADGVLYTCTAKECRALDLKTAEVKIVDAKDSRDRPIKKGSWTIDPVGSFSVSEPEVMIKAGNRLYVAAGNGVSAIELPLPKSKAAKVSWRVKMDGKPAHLLAADDRLFVVTREGRICCFGPERVEPKTYAWVPTPPSRSDAWAGKAKTILDATKIREGYCIAWGVGSGRLITELAGQTDLRIIAVDPDERKVEALRRELAAAGLYGERVAVHAGDPLTFAFPPYLASLMVSEDLRAAGVEPGETFARKAFASLRPHGGIAYLPIAEGEERMALARCVARAELSNAKTQETANGVLLVREGTLPGAANWTHEHADAANTRVSRDQRVQAPLGLLWFGGSSNEGILPRHGHGPQPQILDGRLFIEGVDVLRALDIYTGRVLWQADLPGVGKWYDNLSHQPGANATSSNFVSTPDGIYILHVPVCRRLDPATGQKLAEFKLPAIAAGETLRWSYLNVFEDYLVGGAGPVAPETILSKLLPDRGLSSSKYLLVMDRHSGKLLWTVSARNGFRHNAICLGGGRLYCIDRPNVDEMLRLMRQGEAPPIKPRLLALDLKTGRELWQAEDDVFGTWLSWSAKHDVLVEAGRVARDTLADEPKGMRAFRASDGKVLWKDKTYVGPAMIHGDLVLKDRSACDLLTGAPKMRSDPLTGQSVEWTWTRMYGCNTPLASEHLLTFRSGAAGYFDLCHDGGTGNLGGFRSGCTNNLIVAGGLLVAPDYTRTCTCSYQNQTSLALVHMPEAEMWTYFGAKEVKGPVKRVGLNLGAPGSRRADDGTLWLEYPAVGGPSPRLAVRVTPDKPQWFRQHAARIEGDGLKWVAASGAKGLTSLTVTLNPKASRERDYTLRLHFAEPEPLSPGQRVFRIAVQGQPALTDLDVVKEAGGPNRLLVKEFPGVKVKKDLTVTLTPADTATVRAPILCGIEVTAEGPDAGPDELPAAEDEVASSPLTATATSPWSPNLLTAVGAAALSFVVVVGIAALRSRRHRARS